MEEQTNSLESLFTKTTDYLETKIELLKFKAVDKASDVTSSVISRLVIGLIVALVLLFINIGLAIWIGDLLGKMYYGFFLLGGFYLLVAIILYASRRAFIKRPLNDRLVRKMLN